MSTPSPDAILHLAALHTLSQTGFASTSSSASVTLSNVLSKYLRLVASTCIERANLSGREKVSAIDVVDALDSLGVRIGELIDWTADQDGDYLNGNHLDNLQDYLKEGLSQEDGLAHMRLVPEEELEEFEQDEEEGYQEHDNARVKHEGEDVEMDENHTLDVKKEADLEDDLDVKPFIYRHKSPDLSWLPPLPNSTTLNSSSQATQPTTASTSTDPIAISSDESSSLPTPTQSIADRYRKPISYSSSQLSQAHPFHDPPNSYKGNLNTSPTSLPNLISTYSAIQNEPSIALRQTDLRRQATELLRQSICNVDQYSPLPTLSSIIPQVKSSSIVPSHSDILPTKLLPINPSSSAAEQGGGKILNGLVNRIKSQNLPLNLKERLTSLRPPLPQIKNDQPIFYNDPIKAPDNLSLLKFKGKHQPTTNNNNDDNEEDDNNGQKNPENGLKQIWLKQTWDSGPRGLEKWSKPNLPKGKKVIISKEGEKKPRISEQDLKRKEEEEKRLSLEENYNNSNNNNQKVKVNLRLPSSINNNNGNYISSEPSPNRNDNDSSTIPNGNPTSNERDQSRISTSPTTTTNGPGLKIKFGSQKLSISPSPIPTPQPQPHNEYPASVNPYN
ncbi:uncharacterized protein L201_002150 [Kwoniella dendrophila CBS 6074]|uniref:Bromodomain associated domain-containing protein n=1 Tax=Kwoniella dendrophila CBS 6074 TaxID=1295534 RepID=A0AAX4JPD8_9TREE